MRTLHPFASIVAFVVAAATGCYSTVQGDGGPDASGNGPCPATAPSQGSSCTRNGLQCSFGEDPRVQCRVSATCQSGAWNVSDPGCPILSTCPDSADGAAGQSCSTMNAQCTYGQMACTCTNCGPPYPIQMCSGPTTWHCEGAPGSGTTGCPSPIPNLGTTCSSEGLLCSYNCEGTYARTCTGGVWVSTPQPSNCPISTRSAKRDIQYLDASEVDRLAREIEHAPLATYSYIDPQQPAGRHLGFIIEDQPETSFAVAPDRGHVDLYGYASMLLAAVQSQQRRIESMQAQIDGLRSELDRRATEGSTSPRTPGSLQRSGRSAPR